VSFRLLARCPTTRARAGALTTSHGQVDTPIFMPVGTAATVKGLSPADLRRAGASCILANTYHLVLRPGVETVARLGGLHGFMAWDRSILTDSGGFQVFSLAKLGETDEAGVRFSSHLDRRTVELSPESVVRDQELLGADLIMPLDICLGPEADRREAEAALERTIRWASRAQAAHRRSDQLLFGIVQGGLESDLRRQAARAVRGLGFPGHAIGGLSVGESPLRTAELLEATTAELPEERPRYLMGVGTPEQVVVYAGLGVDMFDCVLPTRLGRTGVAFRSEARLNLRHADFRADRRPIDETCDCAACRRFSRGAIHDALRRGDRLGVRLLSEHNVRALIRTAELARRAILDGSFGSLWKRYRRVRIDPAGCSASRVSAPAMIGPRS
jgi:queuine tRNA-ribosyltransferase